MAFILKERVEREMKRREKREKEKNKRGERERQNMGERTSLIRGEERELIYLTFAHVINLLLRIVHCGYFEPHSIIERESKRC